jgi:hypothetical protein
MLLKVSANWYAIHPGDTYYFAEDPENPDGEEEEQAYPLVDELFSRIEELEVKVWIIIC